MQQNFLVPAIKTMVPGKFILQHFSAAFSRMILIFSKFLIVFEKLIVFFLRNHSQDKFQNFKSPKYIPQKSMIGFLFLHYKKKKPKRRSNDNNFSTVFEDACGISRLERKLQISQLMLGTLLVSVLPPIAAPI